jgi:Domain of unknown function (DUF929)
VSSPRTARSAAANRAAQSKIVQQRAAAQRRSRQIVIASVGIGVVVVLFAALIIAKVSGVGSHKAAPAAATALTKAQTATVIAEATGVPPSVLDKVGAGSVQAMPTKISAPALTVGGKPEVVYFGYEWCPYCATERWPMVVALSRFGTFSGLSLTASSGTDVYPNTNTFTFAKSTYTSNYLTFDPIELQDSNRNTLDTPTAAQQQLLETYDTSQYLPGAQPGSLPFVDLGGTFLVGGASYSPQILAGQSWTQIAGSLATASNPIAQGVDGTANALTAALCTETGQQPTAVCSAPGVVALRGKV